VAELFLMHNSTGRRDWQRRDEIHRRERKYEIGV